MSLFFCSFFCICAYSYVEYLVLYGWYTANVGNLTVRAVYSHGSLTVWCGKRPGHNSPHWGP